MLEYYGSLVVSPWVQSLRNILYTKRKMTQKAKDNLGSKVRVDKIEERPIKDELNNEDKTPCRPLR
jgi:hypothetical protein